MKDNKIDEFPVGRLLYKFVKLQDTNNYLGRGGLWISLGEDTLKFNLYAGEIHIFFDENHHFPREESFWNKDIYHGNKMSLCIFEPTNPQQQ